MKPQRYNSAGIARQEYTREKGIVYHQRHTVIKMKHIDLESLRLLASRSLVEARGTTLRTQR
jgi:hypothetical protein